MQSEIVYSEDSSMESAASPPKAKKRGAVVLDDDDRSDDFSRTIRKRPAGDTRSTDHPSNASPDAAAVSPVDGNESIGDPEAAILKSDDDKMLTMHSGGIDNDENSSGDLHSDTPALDGKMSISGTDTSSSTIATVIKKEKSSSYVSNHIQLI